jgi:hypothetical protein
MCPPVIELHVPDPNATTLHDNGADLRLRGKKRAFFEAGKRPRILAKKSHPGLAGGDGNFLLRDPMLCNIIS